MLSKESAYALLAAQIPDAHHGLISDQHVQRVRELDGRFSAQVAYQRRMSLEEQREEWVRIERDEETESRDEQFLIMSGAYDRLVATAIEVLPK